MFLLSAVGVSAICLTLIFMADHATPAIPIPTGGSSVDTVTQDSSVHDDRVYDSLGIQAHAVHILDVNTGETLYAKNADTALPLASITKIMTALAASEILPENSTVAISAEAVSEEGDSGFTNGEIWQARTLRDLTLVMSSNDGAHALAGAAAAFLTGQPGASSHDIVSKMNAKADELELTSMQFTNETGLDTDEQEAGAYGSAHDVSQLMAYILKNRLDVLEVTAQPTFTTTNEEGQQRIVVNTNPIVGQIPGILASKTGYSALAGGNLVVAYDAGLQHPIIITVLGSTYDDRFIDVKKLVTATDELLKNTK